MPAKVRPVKARPVDVTVAAAARRRGRAGAAPIPGLLREFSIADLERLRALARERRLEPGDCLYDQGAVAVASFLVTEGRAEVLVRGGPVAEVLAGAMIGDVDVLGRRPYRARVVATTPMTVWRIDAADLDRLLLEAPTFAASDGPRPQLPPAGRRADGRHTAIASSEMTGDLLVRGGTLVDGTGAPARPGDVRVRSGRVAEIGTNLAPDGETEIDAGDAYVAPGFIDCHTHYDPSVWWDPLVDPMPQHGVTTVVTGNCSLSLAPVHAADRVAASDVFGFIEDIPVDAFATGIPWTWESYAEWRDVLAAHGTSVNIAALVGHSNLRVYVMGEEAWVRAATDDERAQLAAVLADCLAAGALGLSTSFIDQDRHGNAVPSRAADDAELLALVDVLGGVPGSPRVLEFLPWIKEIDRQLADIERVGALVRRARRAVHLEPAGRRTAATRRARRGSSSRPTRCTTTAASSTRRCRPGPSTST